MDLTASADHITIVDVVIVGAGLSGLTTAYELLKARPGLSLVVIEAQGRVGGRTWSKEMKVQQNGTDRFDVGGQWVGQTQKEIHNLLKELNIGIYTPTLKGDKIAQDAYGQNHRYEKDDCGSDKGRLFKKLNDRIKQVPIRNPYEGTASVDWDKISFRRWLTANSNNNATVEYLSMISDVVLGMPSDQVSFLYLLTLLNSCGGLEFAIEDKNKLTQGHKLIGGAQMASEALANRIGREVIRLSEPVNDIIQSDSSACVTVSTNKGYYQATKIVVAIPPVALSSIRWVPDIPEHRATVVHQLRPRLNGSRFVVTYEKAFWRDHGLSGEAMDQKSGITVCDATSGFGNPALSGLAYFQAHVPLENRRVFVIQILISLFGSQAAEILDYTDQEWSKEENILGCIPSLPPGGYMQRYAAEIRRPFLNVHWAGTETATAWMGYMNGAVQAGKRVASEILHCVY